MSYQVIFMHRKCEEISPLFLGHHEKCGRVAAYLVEFPTYHQEPVRLGPLFMCAPCAHRNVHLGPGSILAVAEGVLGPHPGEKPYRAEVSLPYASRKVGLE